MRFNENNFFGRSIFSGIIVGFGATACASVGGFWGAVIFSTALVVITLSGSHLFTATVGRDSTLENFNKTLLCLIGNICGAFAAHGLICLSGLDVSFILSMTAVEKLSTDKTPFLIQAIGCGFLIGAAMNSKNNPEVYMTGRQSAAILAVIMCVTSFIACGFEHCIADAFILLFAPESIATKKVLTYMALAAAGNGVGGFIAYSLWKNKY